MKGIKPLIWTGDSLMLLDQRELPHHEKYVQCSTAEEVGSSILQMVVRGAPAIGVAAAFAMVLAARSLLLREKGESLFDWTAFLEKLTKTAGALKKIRPTAVNLAWGVEQIMEHAKKLTDSHPLTALAQLEKLALHLYDNDLVVNKLIGEHGAALIPTRCTILTHCNAGALATAGYGTALGVIRSAFAAGKDIHVIADETRPFLQGSRLTAWELQQENIPVTVIVDSAAGYLMSKGEIDAVIVGADRITVNGDVANKIGTYMLAVLAREHHIPFFVAAPFSTFDFSLSSGKDIEVEERDSGEVTHFKGTDIASSGVGVRNPSFDITPAALITAIITERGVIHHPNEANIRLFCVKEVQQG